MNRDLIIVGYSGHAYVVIDALNSLGDNVLGYCDSKIKSYNPFSLEYLGKENEEVLIDQKWIISIGENEIREKIFLHLGHIGQLDSVIHKNAFLGAQIDFGMGVFVSANASINTLCKIGNGTIINTGSIVEHECSIGNFCHVAPGVVLAGNVNLGDRVFVGANATVKQGVVIGNDVTIGAGSVILQDVPDGVTIVGNPGRIIKKN